jgi:hypothetical protein
LSMWNWFQRVLFSSCFRLWSLRYLLL